MSPAPEIEVPDTASQRARRYLGLVILLLFITAVIGILMLAFLTMPGRDHVFFGVQVLSKSSADYSFDEAPLLAPILPGILDDLWRDNIFLNPDRAFSKTPLAVGLFIPTQRGGPEAIATGLAATVFPTPGLTPAEPTNSHPTPTRMVSPPPTGLPTTQQPTATHKPPTSLTPTAARLTPTATAPTATPVTPNSTTVAPTATPKSPQPTTQAPTVTLNPHKPTAALKTPKPTNVAPTDKPKPPKPTDPVPTATPETPMPTTLAPTPTPEMPSPTNNVPTETPKNPKPTKPAVNAMTPTTATFTPTIAPTPVPTAGSAGLTGIFTSWDSSTRVSSAFAEPGSGPTLDLHITPIPPRPLVTPLLSALSLRAGAAGQVCTVETN